MEKALPKKEKTDEVKRTPSRKSTKKVSGSTGKSRYTYAAAEKARDARRPDRGKKSNKNGSSPEKPKVEVKVLPLAPGPLPVSSEKFAKQLGIKHEVVKEIAERHHNNPKLRGADGFADYMLHNLHEFNTKHQLDRHYYHRLFAHFAPKK